MRLKAPDVRAAEFEKDELLRQINDLSSFSLRAYLGAVPLTPELMEERNLSETEMRRLAGHWISPQLTEP